MSFLKGVTRLCRRARGVILHEIVHGLGFGVSQFQNVYQGGKKKEIIVQKVSA